LVTGIELKARHFFQGTVWNIINHPDLPLLFLEIRKEQTKTVSFAAYDLEADSFIWRDISFEEPWWIRLGASCGPVLIFSIYTNTSNPDSQSILAYDIYKKSVIWWKNDFTLTGAVDCYVAGTQLKTGSRQITLDHLTGETIEKTELEWQQNFSLIRPLQYQHGNTHFDTIKLFLERKFRISAVSAIEYVEYGSLIVISCYIEENGLANNLYVISSDGSVLLDERIGERLKGIAIDTFFLLSGYLIFVKNKGELVSYKMV
jgi:hypothetical protein